MTDLKSHATGMSGASALPAPEEQLRAAFEKCHCWYVRSKRCCAKPESVMHQDPCRSKCNVKVQPIQSGVPKLRSRTNSLHMPWHAANQWVAVSRADLSPMMDKSSARSARPFMHAGFSETNTLLGCLQLLMTSAMLLSSESRALYCWEVIGL